MIKRNELVNIGGIRILPKKSIKYGLIAIIAFFFIMALIDRIMPQYDDWKTDDTRILREKYDYHIHDVTNNDYGYPLWQINDYPLDLQTMAGKRILILGDSFVWGDGCSNVNYLWWKRLQRVITENGYTDCSVIAVGNCGDSTDVQLQYLMNTSLLDDIKPDMIIIGYVTNDPEFIDSEGNRIPKRVNPTDYFERGILKLYKYFFPNISYYLNNLINEKVFRNTEYNDETGYPYEKWELACVRDDMLERYRCKVVEPLSEFLQEKEIPVIVVATPSLPSYDYYIERYKALTLFENAGITVYNPLEEYINSYKTNTELADGINIVNSHPGTATNAFISQYVYQILESDYSDVLGSKTQEAKDSRAVINDWFPHALMPKQIGDEEYECIYPSSETDERFLYMPVKEQYVKLCFETPVNIESISISSLDGLVESGHIWITSENAEKGYDNQELIEIGEFSTDGNIIPIKYDNVTQICINLNSADKKERQLCLSLK